MQSGEEQSEAEGRPLSGCWRDTSVGQRGGHADNIDSVGVPVADLDKVHSARLDTQNQHMCSCFLKNIFFLLGLDLGWSKIKRKKG